MPRGRHGYLARGRTIQLVGYLSVIGALAAFFLATRVVALDGRELRARGRSWVLPVCATGLLAAFVVSLQAALPAAG